MNDRQDGRKGHVIGFGGVFFKSKRAADLAHWYKQILGVPVSDSGVALFKRSDNKDFAYNDITVWAPFDDDTNYFAPSETGFMINYLVDDLNMLLDRIKLLGILPVQPVEITKDGKFAWIMDPEGNKIELWQPLRPEDEE
ncbi:MAG: VOC family protein [OCS116 cluster bacterium]|nr:VOC family protein [OCS116 cluster bacterium]